MASNPPPESGRWALNAANGLLISGAVVFIQRPRRALYGGLRFRQICNKINNLRHSFDFMVHKVVQKKPVYTGFFYI